tara:strand:+ start:1273 stop:1962 length:690 start_codon:yes stop_codon:yes gene_type:complete
MSFGGGSSGGGSQAQVNPYAPAQPALNQIISEAGNLYGQGVKASGFVAPSKQTTEGLAAQELMGRAANKQLADTLSGRFLNPFLSPLLQSAAGDIANTINTEFSAAGRTPGSQMNRQQILSGITNEALPLAFDAFERERNRQLGIASAAPSLVQTGSQLENIQRQRNLAPFQSLQQYSSLVTPIATGFPVQQTVTQPNRVTQGLGGAFLGARLGGLPGAAIGGLLGGFL